jgi:pimeloyl-ACP methyl ester carboxylesterase/DNA-binding SARP family transcriptional activator
MMSAVDAPTGRSPVTFARVDGVAIAYQTWGHGEVRLLLVPPFAQNIELAWERPEFRDLFTRLGSFATVMHFDKRGTGASDRAERMPTVDQRVEDTVAVMSAAGWQSAHVVGISEGGPVAIALAATYPDRVQSLTLFGSGARTIGDETETERAGRLAGFTYFRDRWGTEDTVTLEVFAPSVANDPGYRAWEPRYERQSATPAAIGQLLEMVDVIDVRPLLGQVAAPVLLLHRLDDHVVSIDRSRETHALLPTARLVELAGTDHMPHVGDTSMWIDQLEQFVTGTITRHSPGTVRRDVRIETMEGFRVIDRGQPVPASAWGSRQARQVCKRLVAALGRPVPRDELADMLWPDELDDARRGARLSVVLSNVRRVLDGGLIADRDAVRLDLDAVSVDLVELELAIERGDDDGIVEGYRGVVFPEDAYEQWAIGPARRVSVAVAGARRRLATAALRDGRSDDAVGHAIALLDLDGYDERAHELLVSSLTAAGRHGEAQRAIEHYESVMHELGLVPSDLAWS